MDHDRNSSVSDGEEKLDCFNGAPSGGAGNLKVISTFVLQYIEVNMGGVPTTANLPGMCAEAFSVVIPIRECFRRVRGYFTQSSVTAIGMFEVLITG